MNCLLVAPHFSEYSYWNYREVCELFGKRYPAAPLGLATVAALLPAHWELRLLDLNVRDLDDSLIDWADLVMTGGMVAQQRSILAFMEHCRRRGKRVVVGGQDPTSTRRPIIWCSTRRRRPFRPSSPTWPPALLAACIGPRRNPTSR